MKIYAKDGDRYFRIDADARFVRKHNNGRLLSMGLTVGQDLDRKALEKSTHVEVTRDEWNHSACQSSCIMRGGAKCTW